MENAYRCGAVGAILYSDPADVTYHTGTDDSVYPTTWYLPGWAAQRGTILKDMMGDPLSHGLPSKGKSCCLVSHHDSSTKKIHPAFLFWKTLVCECRRSGCSSCAHCVLFLFDLSWPLTWSSQTAQCFLDNCVMNVDIFVACLPR